MDPKTAALGLFLLRELMHCIRRWSSERLLQSVDIDNLEKPDLLLAMEDMLRQVRRDYHPNTEFYLWEIVADFHREYRDPGMMSKWQYINAFVPRPLPLVENIASNLFQNAFITADPGYSPPLQPQSAPIVDSGPDVIISTNPTISRSHLQSLNDTTNRLSASLNTDDALAWKLSANAKARLLYKSSPFYRNVMALTIPQYGRSSKNESVLTFKLQISSSLSQRLMSNPHYSIMVFCASKEIPTSQQMLMEFPDDCYIRVNKRTLDWRPRGVKNKPGTFTPADITKFCMLQESRINHVELRYSNASKVFQASLHLVCPINAKTIVDSLIQEKFIPKEATYRALEKKIKDDDIMELSSTLSLKCPLGVQRIEVPCRSSKCQHLQCFDAFTFLSLNKNVQRWICPVCNRIMDSWDEIIVDGYCMDILKSTPKNLKNVNVHPDGKWEIPAAIISIDIDDSTSISTESGSSSSEPTSHGTDHEPIYVIDDDDDDGDDDDDDDDDGEDNQNGSDSSYDTALADFSMEAKKDEVNGTGSRSNYGSSGHQESQAVRNYPLVTISPKPDSTLLHLQRVPEKSQFMDLTLCSSDDVIDLTSDNEDEDQEQVEGEKKNEEKLTSHRRKRAFIQPENDSCNEINDITLTTNDITLTNDLTLANTGKDSVKCRRISNRHDNSKRTVDSLFTAGNHPEPWDANMDDLTQPRISCSAKTASTSAMLPKDPSHGYTHPYHTSDLQSTLPPTTHYMTPVAPFSPSERLSSPTNGDLTLLQFESAPYTIGSLDSIMEGLSGHSSAPGVSESAIPLWPAYDPTFVSPYTPYSLGIFGQTSGSRGADGYQGQAGLSSNCEQGEELEVDERVGGSDGEESEERPSKRPYTSSGVPSPSSRFSPEPDHETEVRLKSVLKQYLATL